MPDANKLIIDRAAGQTHNERLQVTPRRNTVELEPIYRIIALIEDFVLEGVAGMLVDGSLTVYFSTGIPTQGTVYYGLSEDNLTEAPLDGQKKYHSFVFPTTFVDSYHYFRVEATDPATGQTKSSDVFRVYVTSEFILEVFVPLQPPMASTIPINERQQLPASPNITTDITFNAEKIIPDLFVSFGGANTPASDRVYRTAVNTTEVIEIQTTVEPIP